MFRNSTKMAADRRAALAYQDRAYTSADGRTWTFWSMAPGRAANHWVTDGTGFAMADEHGLLPNQQVSFDTMGNMLAALETGRAGALAPTLRMADDAFAGGACLVVSGPSSPSKAQVAEAMRRYACTRARTLDEVRVEGRRQIETRRTRPAA